MRDPHVVQRRAPVGTREALSLAQGRAADPARTLRHSDLPTPTGARHRAPGLAGSSHAHLSARRRTRHERPQHRSKSRTVNPAGSQRRRLRVSLEAGGTAHGTWNGSRLRQTISAWRAGSAITLRSSQACRPEVLHGDHPWSLPSDCCSPRHDLRTAGHQQDGTVSGRQRWRPQRGRGAAPLSCWPGIAPGALAYLCPRQVRRDGKPSPGAT